jgi:DNA polymerase III epsilon subunit-like protein
MQQAVRLREVALSVIENANQNASTSRRVTKKAAFTVILRSLEKTRNLPFSLREHMAMKELSRYIGLAQTDKIESLTLSHTDLLPISHPRSTREHSLTASALRLTKSRWYADDPRITDERAKVILASAFSSEPGSVEHTYYASILSGLSQGMIPADALIAAGNPFSGKNSSAERSLRARLQRRDREGKFAFMGGGLSALVRRANGQVFNLVGRPVIDGPNGDDIQMELPNGKIVNIPASKGMFTKAIINQTSDGFSKNPAKTATTSNIINESDLVFVDSPNGWNKIAENVWSDGNWEVEKGKDGKFRITRDASNGKQEFLQGNFSDWEDVLDGISDYEEKNNKKKANLPKSEAEQKPKAQLPNGGDGEGPKGPKKFDFKYPDGAYKIQQGREYDPEGRIDEESTDFTDDPVELAQMQDVRDLVAGLEEAVLPQGDNENAFGYGALRFNRGDELVPADAIYNALKEAGEDADLELARIYDKALGSNDNENALLDSRKGAESVGQSSPQLEESFKRVTEEGTSDVAPAATETPFIEEERDLTPLPPLLDGLSETEVARFVETKDHTPHLPTNEDIQMPEGYNTLNPAPFESWQEVTPDNPSDVLPEGFSDNPVFLSQSLSKRELLDELRRSIEPGNEAPGYGAISLETEDGDKFTANVPGEAIRDALQLQGVDTNAEIKNIADEGFAGQEEEKQKATLPTDEPIAELPLDIPVEKKPMNAYERLMAENQAARDAVENRKAELDKAAADRVDEQGRNVPEGWGIERKNKPFFGALDRPENHFNVYGRNNFEARVDENGKITLKDNNNLLEAKTYDSWEELQADFDSRKAEYAAASRAKIKEFAKAYGFSDEQVNAFDSMTEQEIADFFANPENHTPEYASALDDADTSWAVDLPNNAQKQRWNNFRKNERIAEHAGDFPDSNAPIAQLPSKRVVPQQIGIINNRTDGIAPNDFPETKKIEIPEGTVGEKAKLIITKREQEVYDILREEEDLADKLELEEDMTRSDAQGAAAAEMKKKYGKTSQEALAELPRSSANRILLENETRIKEAETPNRPPSKITQGFLDSLLSNLRKLNPINGQSYPRNMLTPEEYEFIQKISGSNKANAADIKLVEDKMRELGFTPKAQEDQEAIDKKEMEDLQRRLNQSQRKPGTAAEGEKKTVSAEVPKDFEADSLEEVPDGLAEYPKPADVAPADGPNGPYRIKVKVTELQPGDITVGDHFVIEEIGEKVPGTTRLKIKGHYPGHVSQDTKQWNDYREIEVIRGAVAPEAGELPVLSKPKEQEFGKRKRNADGSWGFADPANQEAFDAAMADYNARLDEAKKRFPDPTSPSNQPQRTIVRAADVKPGDVTTDPKKGHFVIERTFVDETTKPGFVSVEGYYPGHTTQRKEWRVDTQIDVLRNVDVPEKGDLPELHRPNKTVNGKWIPDNDVAKNEEWQKQIDEAAARWQAPENLPLVENMEQTPEAEKDIPNVVAVKRPAAPQRPAMPAFQGDWAAIAREAGGDWNKFKELLKGKTLVFFDFETTGLKVGDGDEPWQIGAVKVVDGKVVERKNIYMNPGRSIDGTFAAGDKDGVPNAVDADGNKLTDEFLAQQKNQKEAFEEFLAWAGPDALFGAHNVVFDDMVARHLADKHGVDFRPAGYVDTMVMARDIFKNQEGENKPPNNKLVGLAEHLDVELTNAHSADADSEATANVFGKLVDKAIELDAGKDLLDVDAREEEYVKKLDDYNIRLSNYETDIANFAAVKAMNDAFNGKEVKLDDVVTEAKGVDPVDPEGISLGQVGNEFEQPVEKNDVVVLDFTPNADYPKGKMRLMPREWVLNDENTFLMDREDARLRNLLPGDFMSSKDGNTVWQVVAVRAGEELMLQPGKVRVYRRNVDTGEMSTYENFHGMRADGVRRAKNPADLNAPDTVAPGETSYVANKEDLASALENKEFSSDVMEKIDYPNGAGRIFIKKGEDGKFALKAVFFDEEGNEGYIVEDTYRTAAGAHAEGRALLDAHVNDLIAAKREEQAEPAESRPKDVPISRGVIPAGEDNAPQIIEVDNLPENVSGKIRISDVGEEKPVFSAEAVLQDEDGDLLGQQTTEHSNKKEAESEGRDFLKRMIEALEAQLDGAIAKQKDEEPKKPSKPKKEKELSEAEVRVLENNDWVEANTGLLADEEGLEIKVGDFFDNRFFNRYEEILSIEYIGNVNGVYDRVKYEVFNVYNNQVETRYFENGAPLRGVRRPGIEDQTIPERASKGKARGGPRGLIARKAPEERILAKDRRMAGKIDAKAGFFIARNGVALQAGDIVRHKDPVKDALLGRGVVKYRVGAQVDEGAKARGLVRGKGDAKRIVIDELMIQWENEDREYALNQGGVTAKSWNLIFQTDDVDGIVLPAFKAGRARQNPGRDPGVAVVPDARPRDAKAKAKPGMPEQIDNNKVKDLNGGNFETNLIKIGDVYEGALINKDNDRIQIVIRTTDKQEAFNKLAEVRQDIRLAANGDEAMEYIDNLDIVQPAKNIEPDEIKSFNFIDADGNMDKDNVRANVGEMVKALGDRVSRMPNGNERNEVRRAIDILERIEIGFDPDRPERLDTADLESAVRKLKRAAGDEGAAYGKDLDILITVMRERARELKDQQAKVMLDELNKPFANAIPDANNMDAAQLRAAVQEMIDRLPKKGMAYNIDENYLSSVRHGLETFILGIEKNEDIPYVADTDGLGIAIHNLEVLKNRGIDLPEYSQRILEMGQAVMKYKRDNKKDPVKANMPFVDPLVVAEKRIADNTNAVDLKSFPMLRDKIAKGNKNKFMQEHLEEIQDFFAKDSAPMASLSPEARQTLSEYLTLIAHNGSIVGVTPEETKANANELGRMLFAIREEKKALNPERKDFGGILGPLQQIDKDKLFDVANELSGTGWADAPMQKFIVNGVDTGFYVKRPEKGGINATFQLIHAETGQVIYMKRESSKERAKTEQAALELARALGIFGVPTFEWHPSKEDVFFLTSAGDNANFEGIVTAQDFIEVDNFNPAKNGSLVKRMVLADGVAFGILDGILFNTDRHSVNFLFGINKVGNAMKHGELQVLPIDHGFAYAINGERRVNNKSVVDLLGSEDDGRNGNGIAVALAKSVGAITYKELADLSVQQAIQLLERGEYGKDADPAMIATILERLRQFQGIDITKIANRLGDK